MAHLRRREEAIDDDRPPAVPGAFVFQLPPEFAHRGIGERPGQLGLARPLTFRSSMRDRFVLVDEIGAEFVQGILPRIASFPMSTGQPSLGLLPTLRALSPSRDGLLCSADLVRRLAVELRNGMPPKFGGLFAEQPALLPLMRPINRFVPAAGWPTGRCGRGRASLRGPIPRIPDRVPSPG